MSKKLKILSVSPEVAPFAKTGGLTDVAGSLPKALAARGHEVRIAMPCYARIKEKDSLTDLPVEMDGSLETVIIRKTHLGDIPVYLVDNYKYFCREGMYCYADDAARFNFFVKPSYPCCPGWIFNPISSIATIGRQGPCPCF